MVTTVHLLAGATIAIFVKEPILVLLLAFTTHYILDAVPHYAPKPVKGFKSSGLAGMSIPDLAWKAIEPVLGILLVVVYTVLFARSKLFIITLGCLFAWLPDALVFFEWKYGIKRPWPLRQFENKTHRHTDALHGIPPQLVVGLILGALLISAVN